MYLDHQRDLILLQAQGDMHNVRDDELRSPTIRDLLDFEVEMGVNPSGSLPRLKEKSAAMGLLWVRRQLQYQTLLFDNVMGIPAKFSSTAGAVSAAYKSVYDRYHGWAVQKIFSYSFQSAPEAEEIYKHMNPRLLEEVMHAGETLKEASAEPVIDEGAATPDVAVGDDNPFVSFFNHVGGEWDKLVASIGKAFLPKEDSELSLREGSNENAFDNFVTQEMIKDAHGQIKNYLKVGFPLLSDLEAVFDELNMDDPSKV